MLKAGQNSMKDLLRAAQVERKPHNFTPGKKIALIFAAILVALFLAEGIVRITNRGPRWFNPIYAEVSKNYPDLEALIRDTQYNQSPPKYYDEFLYAAAPYTSTHLNYTDYYSARLTPDSVPIGEATYVVWTFGGSTMENSETTDSLTIANTWAKIFNEAIGTAHVKNFGTGGFFSTYELIKFQKLLRDVPTGELPDLAIFYDGYNDALFGFQYGPGSLQKDLSLKIQALVEHDDLRIGLYVLSRWLSKYSMLWDRTGGRLTAYLLFPLPEPVISDDVLDETVRIYLDNVRLTKAICDEFAIQCFFVLQPLIVTKTPLSAIEQNVLDKMEAHPRFGPEGSNFIRSFYNNVDAALSGTDYFINAAHILDGRDQPDFYDLGHVGAESPPIIGEAIAEIMLQRLTTRRENAP